MSEIKSESITLVDIGSIVPNPKNANRHSIEQIKRLEKLITYQGFRNPLIVSNRTGFLIVGHGRLEAAQNLGLEKLPVIYQDFVDEAQEYSYLISDNEIARWAELDKHAVYTELEDLELNDIELLGIEDFTIEDLLEDEDKKENQTLDVEQTKLLNRYWSDWCLEIKDSIDYLRDLKVFSQAYNKSYLKISFLNALFLGKRITRSATLGYQSHRMFCSGDGNNGSIYDLLSVIGDNSDKSARIRFALQEKPSIEKLITVSGIPMAGHKAPLDFPVELAESLYNEFAENGDVLDPCHGWGGRYLGFGLSKASTYTGVDASDLTSLGLVEMHDDLKVIHGKAASFVCSPFEDTSLTLNSFDFALTSPPYFDREEYMGGDQAHTRYKTYDEFISGFYTDLIRKTHEYLREGSCFCLQVGNQKYDLDKKALSIAEKIGFTHVETRDTKMSGVSDDSQDEIKEVLLIFRK